MMNSVVSSMRSTARVAGRRAFSGDSHAQHHAETAAMWKKVSMVAIPAAGLLMVVNLGIHFTHEEHHVDTPAYSYLRFRKKAFPWGCSDCALFDGECWKKCKEE